jgi:N-acetylglucosaminyldiphosphoundecaprenol N-acetyl-beta-D-mannosaminyltransferase
MTDPILRAAEGPAATRSRDLPSVAARYVLGMRVDATSYQDAVERVTRWAGLRESRYVCVSNVHMVMEAYDDPEFQAAVNRADLVIPDGMPLVWMLRLLGVPGATRVYGPSLMPLLCARAARDGIPVGFVGSTPKTLAAMIASLRSRSPDLKVAYSWSPPFRPLSPSEEADAVRTINASGLRILFVGLGCPKQERWMARHRGQIDATMVGVGAAFDFLAGTKRQAPPIMQRYGLEWAFRLISEPRRLWRRYLYHNPRFLLLVAGELARRRPGPRPIAQPGPAGGSDNGRRPVNGTQSEHAIDQDDSR